MDKDISNNQEDAGRIKIIFNDKRYNSIDELPEEAKKKLDKDNNGKLDLLERFQESPLKFLRELHRAHKEYGGSADADEIILERLSSPETYKKTLNVSNESSVRIIAVILLIMVALSYYIYIK